MKADANLWGLIAICLLALLGLCLVAYGVVRLTRRNRERDWPTVRGTIRDAIPPRSAGDPVRESELEYTYEFAGNKYRSTRVTPLPRLVLVRYAAERPTRGYELGADVVVYVNPRDPAHSVLEPAQQPRPAMEIIAIGALAVLTAWVMWIGFMAGPA